MFATMAPFSLRFQRLMTHARRAADRARRWAATTEPWKIGLVGLCVALMLALLIPVLLSTALVAIVVALAAGWVHEFVALMRTPASAFPGRHDRLIWVVAFFLFAPLAFPAFWMFRRSEWGETGPWGTNSADKPTGPWDEEGLM